MTDRTDERTEMNARDIDFPKLVRVMRKGQRISQGELAQLLANMGHEWHQNTVSRIELGKQEPTLRQVLDLDAVLRLGLFDFQDGYDVGYRAGITVARNALEKL